MNVVCADMFCMGVHFDGIGWWDRVELWHLSAWACFWGFLTFPKQCFYAHICTSWPIQCALLMQTAHAYMHTYMQCMLCRALTAMPACAHWVPCCCLPGTSCATSHSPIRCPPVELRRSLLNLHSGSCMGAVHAQSKCCPSPNGGPSAHTCSCYRCLQTNCPSGSESWDLACLTL